MVTLDYEKYKDMSKESIFNQLLKEEKKLNSFNEKLKTQQELVNFLKKELKNKLSGKAKKNYTLENSPALKFTAECFNSFSEQEQEKIKNEVLKECGLLNEN